MSKLRVEYFGITDEVDTCDHCGKQDLKKAIMLFILDADGNRDELVYYGTTCAAKALSVGSSQVTRMAEEADQERLRKIDRVLCYLTDMDPMGRHPREARFLWMTATKAGVRIDVNGVTYGPNEPDGFKFLGFSAAMQTVWNDELDSLHGRGSFKGTRPETNRFIMTGW